MIKDKKISDSVNVSLLVNEMAGFIAQNTVISPNFLKWKFCRMTAFLQSCGSKLSGNCAYPRNFHTRKLVEITVFYTVSHLSMTEVCSESSHTSKMRLFDGLALPIFTKSFVLDI